MPPEDIIRLGLGLGLGLGVKGESSVCGAERGVRLPPEATHRLEDPGVRTQIQLV